MEDRMARMELLMERSIRLQQSFQAAHEIMQLNLRRNEENWRSNEENWRRIEQNVRRIEQDNVRLEEQMQESRELLEQLLQAVAVMQADIVRIDETHA